MLSFVLRVPLHIRFFTEINLHIRMIVNLHFKISFLRETELICEVQDDSSASETACDINSEGHNELFSLISLNFLAPSFYINMDYVGREFCCSCSR